MPPLRSWDAAPGTSRQSPAGKMVGKALANWGKTGLFWSFLVRWWWRRDEGGSRGACRERVWERAGERALEDEEELVGYVQKVDFQGNSLFFFPSGEGQKQKPLSIQRSKKRRLLFILIQAHFRATAEPSRGPQILVPKSEISLISTSFPRGSLGTHSKSRRICRNWENSQRYCTHQLAGKALQGTWHHFCICGDAAAGSRPPPLLIIIIIIIMWFGGN